MIQVIVSLQFLTIVWLGLLVVDVVFGILCEILIDQWVLFYIIDMLL